MRFVEFVGLAMKAVFSTFLVIGLLCGVALSYVREVRFNVDVGLSAWDGFWFVLGLPVLLTLLTLLASPIAFWLFRWIQSPRAAQRVQKSADDGGAARGAEDGAKRVEEAAEQ